MADVPETPMTRLEQYWAGILDKIEGGGNPNYVENIVGTLANPWGDVDIADVVDDCTQQMATIYLLADGTAIGLPEVELNLQRGGITSTEVPFAVAAAHTNNSDIYFNGFLVVFDISTGTATAAVIQNDGDLTNLLPYTSQIPTALSIIHHPLPDTTP